MIGRTLPLCETYPAILWGIGQTFFPFQANGSIVNGPDGKPVGSLLVAQPFTKDEYFQPPPAAVSYDLGLIRARRLPTIRCATALLARSGPSRSMALDQRRARPWPETSRQSDKFGGEPGIVAQWAEAHNSLAQGWVTADPTHAAYIDAWAKANSDIVAQFVKDNPGTPQPKASDLAVLFFEHFSKDRRTTPAGSPQQ